MSTILKALRRIEEDKARGAERPLREDVVLVPPARRRMAPSVLIAVAAVAFATTVALLSALRERSPARAPAVAAAPAPRAPLPLATQPPAPKSVAAPPSVVAEPTGRSGSWASQQSEGAGALGRAVAPVPEAASEPRPAAPIRTPDAEPLGSAPPPEVVVLHPGAKASMRPAASVLEPDDASDEIPIPVAPAKPKRVAAAPSPHVLRTSWHPLAEKRVAWVQVAGGAATPVHEGDQVGSYRVREIEPAAVVFDDGAAEIRRNVGAR